MAEALPSALLGILDHGLAGARALELASEAEKGGLAWLLLRAPELDTQQRVQLALKIRESCPGLTVSIHADPEAAAVLGAGVHYPARMLKDIEKVRDDHPRGVSCHDGAELAAAASLGADYCFLSPVYPPASKSLRGAALGAVLFGELSAQVELPVYALGGVRPEHAKELKERGAAGIAVLGGLFGGDDTAARTARYCRAVREAFGKARM